MKPNESQRKFNAILLSDIHLDFIDEEEREKFFEKLQGLQADFFLIGGDIADGRRALLFLEQLQTKVQKKIYFILGNHDFYGESIIVQRERAQMLTKRIPDLVYLTFSSYIPLSPELALVGSDGWADAQEGEFFLSNVSLRDYFEIEELKACSREERFETLKELGQDLANSAEEKLKKALELHDKVIFLTHPPPFRSVCLYEGSVTDDDWAPHFVCKAMGEMLTRVMLEHPSKNCVVYAGHSHHEAYAKILPNLEVYVTGSIYGEPEFHSISL